MRVGLTGGVGSGKSTVAALLAEHGAIVIDADALAREVVEPGTPGFVAVVEKFGSEIVGPDGALDRAALAAQVFNDDAKRAELNAIVHPLVGRRMHELAEAAGDAIVVYDVPLLVENELAAGFDFVVVVLADETVRLARLADRGMPEADARARMAVQASDEQRRAVADAVIENDGTRAQLSARVDEVWAEIRAAGSGLEDARTHQIESSFGADTAVCGHFADVAQLVAHHLAKVRVAGSNPVVRSEHADPHRRPQRGGVAERRGNGLQSRVHGFKSRRHLAEQHRLRCT